MFKTTKRALVVIAAAAVGSALVLKWLPVPFAWIAFAWGALVLRAAAALPQRSSIFAITVGSVALGIGVAELYFAYTLPPDVQRRTVPALFREDALLGWKLRPSQVVRAIATLPGKTVYDVTYTIDASGHRLTPPLAAGNSAHECVFFFADSFVFGEGVEDQESLPYQFGRLTDGRVRIINFAAPGYGAEHMLAILERGELSGRPPCEPTHVIYVALPHHVLRAAGKTPYSTHGPRYRLRPDQQPEYAGTKIGVAEPTVSHENWLRRELDFQLSKSSVRRALLRRPPRTTEADIELYEAILKRTFQLMEHRWPSAQLHVIGWDIHDFFANGRQRFHRVLDTVGAHVDYIDDIVPGYTDDVPAHSIHPLELHPNARTYATVARYLAARVLAQPAGSRVGASPLPR